MSLELLQDIHLSDDNFWTDFQYYWSHGAYSRALKILQDNQQLVTKYVSAEWFNALTTFIYQLETLPNNFNKKQIKVSYIPPDLDTGDIWFQLELGDINIDVGMFIIPAGSTSVTGTYSNTLINAVAFKNLEEILINQTIDETNHSVIFSLGESLDYPVICMVYSSDNVNLNITTKSFSTGAELFSSTYSGEILSIMCLQNNVRNMVDMYNYNSEELFFKMSPATEAGIVRICSIPTASLSSILNVGSGILSQSVLNLTCDGYMVNSLLTQADNLIATKTVSGSVATFDDAISGTYLKSLDISVLALQEGSGDPSPSNLRPISGRTNLILYQSGENTSEYNTQEISWVNEAGIIYGGSLDVINGILVIDRIMVTLDGSMSWSIYSSGGTQKGFLLSAVNAGISDALPGLSSVTAPYVLSRILPVGTTTWAHNYCGMQNKNLWFGFQSEDFNGVTAFESYLNEHPIQMIVPIATPLTYNITPYQILTLEGENNIWSNSGNIEAEYYTNLNVEQFVLTNINFNLNKVVFSKLGGTNSVNCKVYYT